MHPERARLVFGILLAAVTAAAIKIVGVLRIVALMMIPAATVSRFASNPEAMAASAAATGAACVVGGCSPWRSSTRRPAPRSWSQHCRSSC